MMFVEYLQPTGKKLVESMWFPHQFNKTIQYDVVESMW